MRLAALPFDAREDRFACFFETDMRVADDEFQAAQSSIDQRLEDLGLISHNKDMLKYTRWSITDKGMLALKEINGFSNIQV